MKQKVLTVALGALVLVGYNVEAAKTKKEGTQAQVDSIKSMPGGWSNAEVTSEVEAALDFVLKQMNTSAKLEKILGVKTQVVAGINYAIDFQLDNGQVWNTIVFRDLSGNYSMTKPATRGAMASDVLETKMTGSDRDAHGCISSAGYAWCTRTKQCERPWELAKKQKLANTREAFDKYCDNPAQ